MSLSCNMSLHAIGAGAKHWLQCNAIYRTRLYFSHRGGELGGGLYFEQHNFFKDQREILQNPSGKRLVGYSVVQGSIK